MADLTGNAADLQMAFARRNAVVLFGDEARDDYDAIKIAEIVRDSAGALLNNEAYIPPALRIDTSPFLMGGRAAAAGADGRQAAPAVRRPPPARRRQHRVQRRRRHPVPAAQHDQHRDPGAGLRGGERRDQPVAALPDDDPGGRRAGDVLARRRALEAAGVRAHRSARHVRGAVRARDGAAAHDRSARRTSRCRWTSISRSTSASWTRIACSRATHYVLAVRSELPAEQLVQRLPGLCKIASQAQLPQVLRSAATPGVPIQATHRPPAEIPVRAGVTYFQLNLQNDYWRSIAAGEGGRHLPAAAVRSRAREAGAAGGAAGG